VRAGLALRLRWLWPDRTDPGRAWNRLNLQFTAREQSLFFASTFLLVGDGCSGKFWEDRWINGCSIREIALELYACIPKRRRKVEQLQKALRPIAGRCGHP
jgi:hypothetical protein